MSEYDYLYELQPQVRAWSDENFPDQPADNPQNGIGEEIGELFELESTGVHPSTEDVLDAVGDLLIFTLDFCGIRGIDIEEAMNKGYSKSPSVPVIAGLSVGDQMITHSILKQNHGIRLDENEVGIEAEMRGVAYLVDHAQKYLRAKGYTVDQSLRVAWDGEVVDREWDSAYRDDNGN